jgi:hypothetical protein
VVGVTGSLTNKVAYGQSVFSVPSATQRWITPWRGIGRRLDGWANRDLNVGAIMALAPNVKPLTDLAKIG